MHVLILRPYRKDNIYFRTIEEREKINTKVLLFQFEFGHVWLNPYSVEPNTFISEFKLRLIDSFQQSWRNDVESNNKLHLYNNFKCEFNYEPYLNIVCDRTLRQLLTKFILSSHALRIETARYGRHRIDRAERLCLFCDLRQLDDEFHLYANVLYYMILELSI